jgi:hypothetical protein
LFVLFLHPLRHIFAESFFFFLFAFGLISFPLSNLTRGSAPCVGPSDSCFGCEGKPVATSKNECRLLAEHELIARLM